MFGPPWLSYVPVGLAIGWGMVNLHLKLYVSTSRHDNVIEFQFNSIWNKFIVQQSTEYNIMGVITWLR